MRTITTAALGLLIVLGAGCGSGEIGDPLDAADEDMGELDESPLPDTDPPIDDDVTASVDEATDDPEAPAAPPPPPLFDDGFRAKQGKGCADSDNHSCPVHFRTDQELHLAHEHVDPNDQHHFMVEDPLRVTGGRVVGTTMQGYAQTGVVSLNLGVWKWVQSEKYFLVWNACAGQILKGKCPPGQNAGSGWARASSMQSPSNAQHAAEMKKGKKIGRLGWDQWKGDGERAYTIVGDVGEQIEKSYALEPIITDRSMGWHYTDFHDGGPLNEVYIVSHIAGGGIDKIPNGSTFMNETKKGKAIRVRRKIYDAGTTHVIGEMVFAWGHVKGENVHGWMAVSNMKKGGTRLTGYLPK